MKGIKKQLILLLVFLLFSNFTRDAKAQTEDLYRSSMRKALEQLDTAKDSRELLECRGLFERIAMKFTSNWQPVYYVAYCDVQLVYFDAKSAQNGARLDDAQKQLEKLALFAEADKSEVSALWGYYYNARIVADPGSSRSLFGQVIASYEKAIEENPGNPRPVILRAFFNQHLPSFVKLKIDAEAEVKKAAELFEKEEKTTERPYWGEYFIKLVKTN